MDRPPFGLGFLSETIIKPLSTNLSKDFLIAVTLPKLLINSSALSSALDLEPGYIVLSFSKIRSMIEAGVEFSTFGL